MAGVKVSMVPGEAAVSVATNVIQLSVATVLVSGMGNTVHTTPSTASQLLYKSIQPKIVLGPKGVASCFPKGGYAQFSLWQWVNNPYKDSQSIMSPLLGFSSSFNNDNDNNDNDNGNSSVTTSAVAVSTVPAYTISLQYSKTHQLDKSADNTGKSSGSLSRYNITLPECTVYDGTQYVPCGGCNISSYTNTNVTYNCYDISKLCPVSSPRRVLEGTSSSVLEERSSVLEGSGSVEGTDTYTEGGETDYKQARSHSYSSAEDDYDYPITGRGFRALEGDDDGTAPSTSTPMSAYGVLFRAIAMEISSVLTTNPLLIDVKASVVVLAVVGSSLGLFIILLILFLRYDHIELIRRKYLHQVSEEEARKLFKEEIKNGGVGDVAASYQVHIRKMKEESAKKRSIMGNILHSSSMLSPFSDFKKEKKTMTMTKAITKTRIGESTYETRHSKGMKGLQRSSYYPQRSSNYDYSVDCSDLSNDQDQVGNIDSTYGTERYNDRDRDGGRGREKDGDRDRDWDWDRDRDRNTDNDEKNVSHLERSLIVAEFLNKLFPGQTIFTKNRNALDVITANHEYSTMFTSSLIRTRTIRFLRTVINLLVCLFVDTVFYGIYFPAKSNCTKFEDKVIE